MYLFFMIVFHILSNLPIEQSLYRGIHARFWMQVIVSQLEFISLFLFQITLPVLQPHAIASLLVGLGALHVMTLMSSSFSLKPRSHSSQSTLSCAAVVAAVIAARIMLGWSACDQSNNFVFLQHGHAILDYLPKGCWNYVCWTFFDAHFVVMCQVLL
jgi:hypothetical protein